jgi:hypothetical protein
MCPAGRNPRVPSHRRPARTITARITIAALVALAVAGGACGNDDDPSATGDTSTTATTATGATSADRDDPDEPDTDVGPLLRPDGVGFVDFGTAEPDAVSQMSEAFGSAEAGTTAEEVCGPRTTATWASAGLTAFFTAGRFDGWSVNEAGLVTDKGIGVSSTIAQAREAYGDDLSWFEGSTLGDELSINHGAENLYIGGLASGTGDSSRIETLWAGFICAAR